MFLDIDFDLKKNQNKQYCKSLFSLSDNRKQYVFQILISLLNNLDLLNITETKYLF